MNNASPTNLARFFALACMMLMAHCAAASARATETMEIPEPSTVRVEMETDLLIYDVAWASHRVRALNDLAGAIVREIDADSGYMIIELPQLPPQWDVRAIRSNRGLTDLDGRPIPARTIRQRTRTYDRDLQRVILALTDRIEQAKPDLHFAFASLEPVAPAARRGGTNYTSAVPGFHLGSTIDWNGNESSLVRSMRGALSKTSINALKGAETPFSFETSNGEWFMASFGDIDARIAERVSEGGGSASAEPFDVESLPFYNDGFIDFPSRQELAHASQHGRVRLDNVEIFPARYERKTNTFVGIALSHENASKNNYDENPSGWVHRYRELPEKGFDLRTLNEDMQGLHDLGIREVWFWGFSGQHLITDWVSDAVMPWYTPDGMTSVMHETWPAFVDRWQAKGFRFGFWLGGTAFPNLGTARSPDHQPIQREHFDYYVDTIAELHRIGFDSVGLDAFTWVLALRDRPEWSNWRDNEYGERDTGIGLALLERLARDPKTKDVHVVTEPRVPYGPMLAECASFKLATSLSDVRRDSRPNAETLDHPHYENLVNPGHEITMYLMGTGNAEDWKLNEFEEMMDLIRELGYRPALNIAVLRELNVLDFRGRVLRDISDILAP